ncbi:MAG: alpha/beta hydrolase [Proteobacteria bacterium]|nr:alpha/beta hydrolase [Pseudomonadota bacterium]
MPTTSMNYRRSGSGPTVVLVHGFLLGSGFWRPLIEYLARTHDVIAPDLPGFAGSGHMPALPNMEDFSDAVLTLMDDLGVDRFSAIGHSMGGCIVQQMALDAGTRLDRLVVYASTSGRTIMAQVGPGARPPRERRAVLEKEGLEGFRRWMGPHWLADGADHPFFDECLASGDGVSLDAVEAGGVMMQDWDVTDRLGDISVPTLVIGGDRDRTFPVEATAYVARHVQNGRLCILPGAAHSGHVEQPELFNKAVGDFLTET